MSSIRLLILTLLFLLIAIASGRLLARDVFLTFHLEIDRNVYDETDYGAAPQFVVWLESPDGEHIRTVWITRRTGQGDWEGAFERLTSLPYWVARYNKETGTKGAPTFATPVADAITGPTPKKEFRTFVKVPEGSTWKVFVEVNASGDYNRGFPRTLPNGAPDSDGNGQPSIVYSCAIDATEGASAVPTLIGRTEQFHVTGRLNPEVESITTAADLLPKIEVKCVANGEQKTRIDGKTPESPVRREGS